MTTDGSTPDALPSSLFIAEGDLVLPTEMSRGPWDPRSLHGGPVAALFADVLERLPADGVEWFVARLSIELERPVPLAPLRVAAEITRPGRKVSIVDLTIHLAETATLLARARALRIRQADVALPTHPEVADLLAVPPAPPGPGAGVVGEVTTTTYVAFHSDATEHRYVERSPLQIGPVVDWIRLRVPIFPDRPVTPLQRVAAAADFANGISHVLDFETHLFINPDLTIHLFRPLAGEWVGMNSTTLHGTAGIGLSDTSLYATDGLVGHSNQSLLLDLR